MNTAVKCLTMFCGILLTCGAFNGQANAQALFSDDFEDRVKDQVLIGNNWTWFEQDFAGDICTGDVVGEWGPWSDGDDSDFYQENRNYWTAGQEDDSYYRAGLEVPAWDGALTNMLRVYGSQYSAHPDCHRVLVFQEHTLQMAGTYAFSFDVAQDQFGAPANGEITGAFVKVLRASNQSYDTIFFDAIETRPPPATSPENVMTAWRSIEFVIPEEMTGELLQFGFYSDLSRNLGQSSWTSAALYDNITMGLMEIGPAHSGSWFNRDQTGHGFSIVIGVTPSGAPLVVVYWYVFDTAGDPIFLVGTGIPVGDTVEIAFTSPIGMIYGDFDPSTMPSPHNDGGTAVFEFSDRDNAVFSYIPSDFTAETWGHTAIEALPITKLFGIPADKVFPTTE